MRILGIDTTRKIARLFAYDDVNDEEYYLEVDENIKHSEGLFLYLEKLFCNTKLQLSDFDILSAVVGPGSFTGIRVGMSVIKGLNKVINKKIIGVNMFEVVSKYVKNGYFLLNSTAGSCYYAKIKNKLIEDHGVVEKHNIIQLVGDEKVFLLREEQNLINLEYNNIVVIDEVWKEYVTAIKEKLGNDDLTFEPFYLQLSQAERNLKNE